MRNKTCLLLIISLLFILYMPLAACSNAATGTQSSYNPPAQRETLVQVSTIDALLNGSYDGVMSLGSLREYGDFGIGTFEGLDGEMLGFDGHFFQVKADGKAYPTNDSMKTPFASVTFFDTDITEQLPAGMSYTQLEERLDSILPTKNIFYAIRIDGAFSYMKTRSVPGQHKPYPPLVEVTKNQPVFEFGEIEGTVAGFRCPDYVTGVNVPGYHLHFLTRASDAGGHILDFTIKQAVASVDYTSSFLMILPGEDSDFYRLDLSQDKTEELEKVEK